jgi:hypothetical protein
MASSWSQAWRQAREERRHCSVSADLRPGPSKSDSQWECLQRSSNHMTYLPYCVPSSTGTCFKNALSTVSIPRSGYISSRYATCSIPEAGRFLNEACDISMGDFDTRSRTWDVCVLVFHHWLFRSVSVSQLFGYPVRKCQGTLWDCIACEET